MKRKPRENVCIQLQKVYKTGNPRHKSAGQSQFDYRLNSNNNRPHLKIPAEISWHELIQWVLHWLRSDARPQNQPVAEVVLQKHAKQSGKNGAKWRLQLDDPILYVARERERDWIYTLS